MKKLSALSRSTSYWILVVISIALAGIGGWLATSHLGSMSSALLLGTATSVDVYVGQSMIVFGAALLGAGIIGILLALVLSAATSLLPSAPVVVEPIDWTAENAAEAPAEVAEESRTEEAVTDEQVEGADVESTQEPTISR